MSSIWAKLDNPAQYQRPWNRQVLFWSPALAHPAADALIFLAWNDSGLPHKKLSAIRHSGLVSFFSRFPRRTNGLELARRAEWEISKD